MSNTRATIATIAKSAGRLHRVIIPMLLAVLIATLLQTVGVVAAEPALATTCPCSLFSSSDTPTTPA